MSKRGKVWLVGSAMIAAVGAGGIGETTAEICKDWHESQWNERQCAGVGGKTEVSHSFQWSGGTKSIRIDCETHNAVFEGGRDKRSSLDSSIQQAFFASSITGKKPVIVIFDSDGKVGQYEHRIARATLKAGVQYQTFSCGDVAPDSS